jgi:hypothetical protein
MKLDSDLSSVLYCTYVGGEGEEIDRNDALTVASDGTIYLAGTTTSEDLDSLNDGAYTRYAGGFSDGIIFRFDSTLSNLVNSTYVGSPGEDYISAMEVGSDNTVYVGGCTFDAGYPLTPDAFDTTMVVMENTFTILDGNLSTVLFSTLIGGDDRECIHALLLRPDERMIYFGGWTRSTDLPTTIGCYDPEYNVISDPMLGAINLTSLELVRDRVEP